MTRTKGTNSNNRALRPNAEKSSAGSVEAHTQTKSCRIVLVDDHPVVREGLARLLSSRPGITIVGGAENAGEGIDLVRKHKPDLVILDMSLAKSDGLELVKQIKAEMPKMPMLVISMHDETVHAERVLRAGARGYLMKKEPSEKIFAAITQVMSGEIYVSDRVRQAMIEASVCGKRPIHEGGSSLDHLSDRELQVFQMLGNGIPTRQIAEQLHLSVKTIESYRENLKTKMNLRSGAELVQRAIQWGRAQAALQ